MKYFIIKLIPFFIFLPFSAFAQNDSLKTKRSVPNEIGIDIANTIFLVRKSENNYLLNYKRHFKNHAIRAGLNLRFESTITGEKSIDSRIGFEWKRTVQKWQFFYGADLGYSFKSYNFQGNSISQYILAPLIGFRYFLSPRFSISTEPKLFMKYIVNKDPKSFRKNGDTEDFEIALGSIGIVLMNFHF